MPPFVRPISRPIPGGLRAALQPRPPLYTPFFTRRAGGRAMGFQILAQAHSNAWRSPAHINHDRLFIGDLGRQARHDTDEHPPSGSIAYRLLALSVNESGA